MLLIKNLIFWGSYLVFPLIAALLIFLIKNKPTPSNNTLGNSPVPKTPLDIKLGDKLIDAKSLEFLVGRIKVFSINKAFLVKIACITILLLSFVFTWARFVEPQLITVQNTKIQTGFSAKFVLISDTHLGVLKGKSFLERVVEIVNQQDNIDAVLIAGDFTYEPNIKDLDDLFSPLSKIRYPVYAILGNHDLQFPGPNLRNELENALVKAKVNIINNQEIKIKNIKILGLGDHWAGEDDVKLVDQYQKEDNVVILTHNPDTVSLLPQNKVDLTLSGHTHCGQVRIPFLYKLALPVQGNYDKGFTQEPQTKLFITCGLGETAVSMRLFNPPVVDVLELN